MIGYIEVPRFEVDVEVAADPGRPASLLVIAHGGTFRGVVRGCCAELEREGVKAGDRVTDVRRRFPAAFVLPERSGFYEKVSREATAYLAARTPGVERLGRGEWLVDLEGCDRLLRHDFAGWAGRMGAGLKGEFGLKARVGVAANRVAAGLACRLATVEMAVVLFPGMEQDLLRRAPLGMLPGISPPQREYMVGLRLQWVWELYELGEARLRQWFGEKEGSRVWREIHGQSLEPVKPYRVPKVLRKTFTFAAGTADVAEIGRAGVYLVSHLFDDARKQGGLPGRIGCRIVYVDDLAANRETHGMGLKREEEYGALVWRMLESFPFRRVMVRSLSLWCGVEFPACEQPDFFGERERLRSRDLDMAMRLIREKYGVKHLHRASGLAKPWTGGRAIRPKSR